MREMKNGINTFLLKVNKYNPNLISLVFQKKQELYCRFVAFNCLEKQL